MNSMRIQTSVIGAGYSHLVPLETQVNENYTEYTCIRNLDQRQYSARKWNCTLINNQFNRLRKLKLYNLLPIIDIDHDNKMIIALDKAPQSLFYQIDILKQEQNQQRRLIIAGGLSIVLQELNRRGVSFNNIDLKTIILFDNHVFLQLFDFDFSQEQSEVVTLRNFNNLLSELFDEEYQFISFQDSSIYFMKLLGINFSQGEWMPYSDMLQHIFQFEEANLKEIGSAYSNSFIFEWKSPQIFDKNVVILKSSKQDQYQDQDDYERCIQRELDIYEGFRKGEPFADCFAYMRIQTQIFLFMERYQCDLEMALRNQIYERNIIPLSSQLIQIIKILHCKHQIMHRDLKPANFFLDSIEIDKARIYLGDFDNSRHMGQSDEIRQDLDPSMQLTVLSASRSYDPPESGQNHYDFSSDIWQLGLILYQIANLGVYPVELATLVFTQNDYINEFTFERINQKLSRSRELSPLPRELVEIIVDCLKYRRSERPTASQIAEKLRQLDFIDEFNSSEFSTNSQLMDNSLSQSPLVSTCSCGQILPHSHPVLGQNEVQLIVRQFEYIEENPDQPAQ